MVAEKKMRDVMVSFSELDISRKIGSGATGSVWRGSWRGAAVAVKMIRSTNRIDRYPKSNTVFGGPVLEGFNCYTRVIRRPFHQAVELMGRDLEVFKREAYLMTRLRHPNIVLIMGVAFAPPGHRITLEGQGGMSLQKRRELGFDDSGETQGSLCIVTELLSRGSLEDVIRAGGLRTASYALILNLALQAARGMLYLHTHSPPIIHRDLKSSNLVVDKHWHVKVTDFGMSRFVPKPVPAVRPSSSNATSAVSSSTASTASTTSAPVAPAPLSPSALAESPGRSAAAASSTPAHPLEILRATGDEGEEQEQGEEEENGEGDEPGHEEEKTSLRLGHPGRPGGMEGGADGGWNSSRRRVAAHGNKAAGRNAPAMGKETEGRGVQELGLTTNVGTVAWAAPEILMIGEGGRGEYTAKVDVYSFGVVLWELWERRRPFEDVRSRFDIADTVIAGGRPTIGRGCPPPYASLIRRCWHQDPSKRPSFQDVVENLERELESVQSFTEL